MVLVTALLYCLWRFIFIIVLCTCCAACRATQLLLCYDVYPLTLSSEGDLGGRCVILVEV